jgi:GTP-binding protein
MRESWQFLPQHFVTSAVKNTGKEDILKFIETCNKSVKSQDTE